MFKLRAEQLAQAQLRHARYYISRLQLALNLYDTGGTYVSSALEQFESSWAQVQQAFGCLCVDTSEEASALCVDLVSTAHPLMVNRRSLTFHIEWLQIALEKAYALNLSEKVSELLTRLSRIYYHSSQWEQSIYYAQQCIEVTPMLSIATAEAYQSWGSTLIRMGCYDEAQEKCEMGLDIAQQINAERTMASIKMNLGLIMERKGNLEAARQVSESALAYARKHQSTTGLTAPILDNLGVIAMRSGDIQTARERWEEALEIDKIYGNISGMGGRYINLGAAAYMLDDYSAARRYFEEAADMLRRVVNRRSLAIALANLGEVAVLQGDADSAFVAYDEAFALFVEIDYWGGMVQSAPGAVDLYLSLNRVEEAQSLIQDCLRHREKFTPLNCVQILSAGARIFYVMGNLADCARLVGFIRQQPSAADGDTQKRLKALQTQLGAALSEAELTALAAQGAADTLTAAFNRLLLP